MTVGEDRLGPRYASFAEFWPFYIREHSRAPTRWLHFSGLLLAAVALAAGLTLGSRYLLLVPIAGYGLAWAGHFFVEGNRPATFRYPLYSLRGDFRMFRLMATGRMQAELDRHLPRTPPP